MTDTTELARWLDARAALKAQQQDIADRLTVVDERIREEIGDLEAAAIGHWRISYRTVATTRVDTKKVKTILEPLGLLERVQTTTETRVLRVTEVDR